MICTAATCWLLQPSPIADLPLKSQAHAARLRFPDKIPMLV